MLKTMYSRHSCSYKVLRKVLNQSSAIIMEQGITSVCEKLCAIPYNTTVGLNGASYRSRCAGSVRTHLYDKFGFVGFSHPCSADLYGRNVAVRKCRWARKCFLSVWEAKKITVHCSLAKSDHPDSVGAYFTQLFWCDGNLLLGTDSGYPVCNDIRHPLYSAMTWGNRAEDPGHDASFSG